MDKAVYVAIFDQCLDDQHSECPKYDRIPHSAGRVGVIGGGRCICECHWGDRPINQKWVDEVRKSSLESRRRSPEEVQGGIDKARDVLANGDDAIAAYLLNQEANPQR